MNDSPRSWSDSAAADARRMMSWHAAAAADDATTTKIADADDDDDDSYHGHGYDCGDDATRRPWCSPNAPSADLTDCGRRASAAGISARVRCACCAASQVSANCCRCCCSCWSCCSAARTADGWDAHPSWWVCYTWSGRDCRSCCKAIKRRQGMERGRWMVSVSNCNAVSHYFAINLNCLT